MNLLTRLLELVLLCILSYCIYELYLLINSDTIPNTFNASAYYLSIYNLTIILIFTFVYYSLGKFSTTKHFVDGDKKINLNLFNALYMSVVTQTTVGYGHISCNTFTARAINLIQLIAIIINITLIPVMHQSIVLNDQKKKGGE